MKPFANTLLLNLAAIVAVIVAVVSYAYRAVRVWYANGGQEFMMSMAANFVAGVHKLSEKIYFQLEDAEYA
jgi:chitinase